MSRPGKHEKAIGWMGLGEGAMTPIYESDYDDEEDIDTPPVIDNSEARAAIARGDAMREAQRAWHIQQAADAYRAAVAAGADDPARAVADALAYYSTGYPKYLIQMARERGLLAGYEEP